MLHRRAGDDHAVVVAVLYVGKVAVKGQHVLLGGVPGDVAAGSNQLQLHLQGRVGQQAAELGLRGDFCGHQVQQQNSQRPDVLGDGPPLRHDKDVLLFQRPCRRQLVGDSDGHVVVPPWLCEMRPRWTGNGRSQDLTKPDWRCILHVTDLRTNQDTERRAEVHLLHRRSAH